MNIRTSLKNCVHQAYWNFNNQGATQIAITRCERGKYYTCMLAHVLLNKLATHQTSPEDIVFCGSRRELYEFVNPRTPELKLEVDPCQTNETPPTSNPKSPTSADDGTS